MKSIFIAMSLAVLSTSAMAAGDAAAGKTKAAVCGGCHGANGVGIGALYPNLAGQKADYIVAQMKAFQDGSRKGANSAMMAPMTAGLSEQDMADIAAYFESLDAAK